MPGETIGLADLKALREGDEVHLIVIYPFPLTSRVDRIDGVFRVDSVEEDQLNLSDDQIQVELEWEEWDEQAQGFDDGESVSIVSWP